LNLLLVEDNPPDALLVREAIRMEGLPLNVHLVADGERAMDFIAKAESDPAAPWPDIMLLDLNLPKVEGFEVLRWLRASGKRKHIPVMVITSSDSPKDRTESAALGAGYFRKPANYDEFLKIGPVLRTFLSDKGAL
jgi:two-component system, chemotaxis family, response regulator Rcp1